MLPTANPTVIFQRVDDGAVLFAPESEVYFGLNGVGVTIWEALPPVCVTLDDLCTHVASRYPGTDLAMIREDTVELLDRLVADRLALRAGSVAPDAPSAR